MGVEHAVQCKHHIVGIEIAHRRKEFGGVELHALAQREGIGQAIARDVPFFGQSRLNVGGAIDEADQLVVNSVTTRIKGIAARILPRIKSFGTGLGTIHQRLARRLGIRGRRGRRGRCAYCRRLGLAAGAQSGGSQNGKCQRGSGKCMLCHESLRGSMWPLRAFDTNTGWENQPKITTGLHPTENMHSIHKLSLFCGSLRTFPGFPQQAPEYFVGQKTISQDRQMQRQPAEAEKPCSAGFSWQHDTRVLCGERR